jgi:hypothetical protein
VAQAFQVKVLPEVAVQLMVVEAGVELLKSVLPTTKPLVNFQMAATG